MTFLKNCSSELFLISGWKEIFCLEFNSLSIDILDIGCPIRKMVLFDITRELVIRFLFFFFTIFVTEKYATSIFLINMLLGIFWLQWEMWKSIKFYLIIEVGWCYGGEMDLCKDLVWQIECLFRSTFWPASTLFTETQSS